MTDSPDAAWDAALDRAYRAAYGVLRDADLARDVAQEACVRALRSRDSFAGRSSFARWVQSIAYRLAIDVWRGRRPLGGDPDEIAGRENPERDAAGRQSASALHRCLANLTPNQRAIFLAKYLDQMKGAEIAAELDVREGTIWATLHQTAKSLRRCLAQHGVEPAVLQ